MKTLSKFPENAKFYIVKNFYNDTNGNPRIFYEIYDNDMSYLGYCEDNYAGTNFCTGRNLKKIGSTIFCRGRYRIYIKSIKNDTKFINESLNEKDEVW